MHNDLTHFFDLNVTHCHPTPQVVYETLPGWKQDISGVRTWEDLPQAARDYCQWIEERLGVHCKWIGVGPGRDAVVVKPLGK